jgi:hypothetical protein
MSEEGLWPEELYYPEGLSEEDLLYDEEEEEGF